MDNASTTIVHRPQSPTASQPKNGSSLDLILTTRNNLKLVIPFNFPPTLEAVGSRMITNLNHYRVYYFLFVWSILFIALLPERKVSLILLVATTNVICLYLLLLRACPNSTFLHLIIDKRLVFFSLAVAIVLEMALTKAAVHLFATIIGATPVILLHALLMARFSLFESEENCVGKGLVPIVYYAPYVHEKNGEDEPLTVV